MEETSLMSQMQSGNNIKMFVTDVGYEDEDWIHLDHNRDK